MRERVSLRNVWRGRKETLFDSEDIAG
jgi:hypothetical protein